MYYDVKSNNPEMLKELAKKGFYPGKKYMLMKQVCIEIPIDLLPKDVNLIDLNFIPIASKAGERITSATPYRAYLFFGHKKFKTLKDGDPIPVVGKTSASV